MKRLLFKFQYPKLALFGVMTLVAYAVFTNLAVQHFFEQLGNLSYLGIFLAGLFFSFGLTTPYAIGLFLVINPSHILLASVIGGFGAFLSDYLILQTVRSSFMKEFHRLEKTWPVATVEHLLKKKLPHSIKKPLLYMGAAVVFASPLPDELGVALLAGLSKITTEMFAAISILANSVGIMILLSL